MHAVTQTMFIFAHSAYDTAHETQRQEGTLNAQLFWYVTVSLRTSNGCTHQVVRLSVRVTYRHSPVQQLSCLCAIFDSSRRSYCRLMAPDHGKRLFTRRCVKRRTLEPASTRLALYAVCHGHGHGHGVFILATYPKGK